jgi:hypothetical protein
MTTERMPEGHPALMFDVAALADNFEEHVQGNDGTVDARTLATTMSEVLRVSIWAFAEQHAAVANGERDGLATAENMFVTQLAAMCPVHVWEWMATVTANLQARSEGSDPDLPPMPRGDRLWELWMRGWDDNQRNGHS